MSNASTDLLKRVIESRLGGSASFSRSTRVAAAASPSADWDGLVHWFDLKNHPHATRAYAWSSSIRGGKKPRYFAVLHMGRVRSPLDAVKEAVAAIRR